MLKVYLAGYMSEKVLTECLAWRKQIVTHYNNWKGHEKYPFIWLDPFNGEVKEITDEGLKADIPANTILHRDFAAVSSADIIVANLDTFGQTRPLTGTIAELAWAWQMRKPIIIITKEKHFREHPFIANFASWIVESVDEMLDKKILNHFYKGLNDTYQY